MEKAQLFLGDLYLETTETDASTERSYTYYLMAANQHENPHALERVGIAYHQYSSSLVICYLF